MTLIVISSLSVRAIMMVLIENVKFHWNNLELKSIVYVCALRSKKKTKHLQHHFVHLCPDFSVISIDYSKRMETKKKFKSAKNGSKHLKWSTFFLQITLFIP